MVFNTTRMAKMPFSNATHTTHTKVMIGRGLGTGLGAGLGTGMGSVLLRTGGPGAGSSYMDMDDYIRTTGINPNTRSRPAGSGLGAGLKGMSSLSDKLSKLSIERPSSKKKNIVMSI